MIEYNDDELKKRIEERKKQAEDRGIEYKAECIVRELGNISHEGDRDSWGIKGTFKIDRIEIANRSGEAKYNDPDFHPDDTFHYSSTTIRYNGGVVFDQPGSGITSYIPGAWEATLDEVYLEASQKRAAKLEKKDEEEKARAAYEKKATINKWGL